MIVKECAEMVNRSEQTVRLWIKKYDIPFTKDISRDIHIEESDWNEFCEEMNIERVER